MRSFFLITSLTAALGLWDVGERLDIHRAKIREARHEQVAADESEIFVRLRAERRRSEADPALWKLIEERGFKRDLKESRKTARELREGRPGGVQADNGAKGAKRPW